MLDVVLPAELRISISRVGADVDISLQAKYYVHVTEYPQLPNVLVGKDVTLTPTQKTQIINFCRDVVLPQL